MKKYYISFGQIHIHTINGHTFDKDCVCEINAPNERDAREKAFETFDSKWSFLYCENTVDKILRHCSRGIIELE